MIELLDYILDYDDNFWIIGYIDNEVKGYIVYKVDENGDRYNHITQKNYKKCSCQKFDKIPAYKKVFKPNEFYINNKSKLTGVWKAYIEVLNHIGITDEDIGIFGSYMIGFDITKDVDFVIYGLDNLKKYYDNNDYIKKCINATYISQEHMQHQYNKHKNDYHQKTDLYEIISRNWSGVQVSEGVLSTPRFIDRRKQHISVAIQNKQVITFEVIDGFKSALLPRTSKVLYNGEEYTVETCLWKYQSFLRKGDIVECSCYVNNELKTLVFADHNCYVKFIKKGKNVL